MSGPACMTEAEWADWQRPIGVPMSRDLEYVVNGGHRAVGRPPSGHPCYDCPLAFHLEQRAAGTCDGYPTYQGSRGLFDQPSEKRERMRTRWREYQQRRRRRAVA